MKTSNKINAVFVMEQHLGHRTHYLNLYQLLALSPRLATSWIPITYHTGKPPMTRLPLLCKIRGMLNGRTEAVQGLRATRNYDIAYFNTQVPAVLACEELRRRPYVISTDITPRQYDQFGAYYGHQPDKKDLLGLLKHILNRLVLQRAAHICVWSQWTRASMVHEYGVAPELISVLPPGIDLECWQPGDRKSTQPFKILFVGGDLYRKGGQTLIDAFRSLPSGSAELHLVTRSEIEREPGVFIYQDLTPNDSSLRQLYREAHVFVLPSEAEAFGIAAAEAAASGLPAIVSDSGGLPETVFDGVSGYVVPVGDTQAVAERLRTLSNDPNLCMRMGRAARAHAEQHFNMRHNAEALVAILLAAVQPDVPQAAM
jgi:glycosyltransferase involved in cell wall biosynthesis